MLFRSDNPEAGLTGGDQVHLGAVGYGDTKNDLADMARLGKKQEFEVREITMFSLRSIADFGTEKFWLMVNVGLYFDLYGNLGIRIGVCSGLSEMSLI